MTMMFQNYQPSLYNQGTLNNRRLRETDKSKIPVMLHQHPSTSLRKHSLIRTEYRGDGVTAPQFSIKSVNKVLSGGKRTDCRRKHSDDIEIIRRQETERQNNLLTSLSMEHINSANVLACVRDSNELLHAKLASSSSRLVEKINDQAELLYKDIQHPKAFKHPSSTTKNVQNKVKPVRKPSTYTEMFMARQRQTDKLNRKKCENISKQRTENENKLRQFVSPDVRNHISTVPTQETETPSPPPKSVPPKKPGEGYSAPKPKVTYKPYTLKDYGAMKQSLAHKAGGLGPDTISSAYKSKLEKTRRIAQYAQKVRTDHKHKDFPKRKSVNPRYQPPSKSEIAHQYASKIPRPIPVKRKPKLSPLPTMSDKEPSILREEILQERVRRHLQHKRILEDLDKV
ncbi:hypothetical protein ACHWQZ_G002034 [Mnemiopsis leidyi]